MIKKILVAIVDSLVILFVWLVFIFTLVAVIDIFLGGIIKKMIK